MDLKEDEEIMDEDVQRNREFIRVGTTSATRDDGNIEQMQDLDLNVSASVLRVKSTAQTCTDSINMKPETPITPNTPNTIAGTSTNSGFDNKPRESSFLEILKQGSADNWDELRERSLDEEENTLMLYLELIDAALYEVYQLMRKDSYMRFVGTRTYKKFIKDVVNRDEGSLH